MGNHFNQIVEPIIGTAAESSFLTDSYNDNTYTISTGGMEQIEFYIDYIVNGSSIGNRDLYMLVEGGHDRSDVYIFQTFDYSGLPTISGYDDIPLWTGMIPATRYKRRVSFPIADRFIRVSFKESGSANFGTIRVVSSISGL